MVLVAIDLDPNQFDKISSAVAEHGYSNVQQFMVAAAWNQLALHEGHGATVDQGSEDNGAPTSRASDRRSADAGHGEWGSALRRVDPSELGQLLPNEVLAGPDALLWGQTNRVLPIAV